MKKENIKYVIGVDGGGTKTIAALADLRGRILSQSKSGSSNPRNIGIKRAVLNITKAVNPLFKRKGIIVSTVITLPAIEEEYQDKKKDILKLLRIQRKISKIFKGKIKINSDQLAAFRAGTDEKDGIILIAGTGCVAHGWRGRKEAKASGWGWLADRGSAFWVGQRVFQAVLKDLDKRGEKTLLTRLVFQELKTKNINDFLKKIYSRNPTTIIPRISIVCDKAIQKGDKIAKKIMIEAGKEVALDAKTIIYELNFQKTKFTLVLAGSMFKTKTFLETVKKNISKSIPKAKFIRLKKGPVTGAVKLALEQVNINF
ncbi:hypothetical protein IH779_02760 [Patescibacteria group bacterium]|nr:hypothetical protein [Patescibacteria group bacterium]